MRRFRGWVIGAATAAALLAAPSAGSAAAWRVTSASRSAGTPSAIACSAGRGCLVVGELNPRAYRNWSSRQRPYLRALSCGALGCIGVGARAGGVTLGAWSSRTWSSTGSAWTRMPFHPQVGGRYTGALVGVGCGSPGDCLAVGNIDAATHVDCQPNAMGLTVCETVVPVLERWNGASWQRQNGLPVPVLAQIALPLGSEQGASSLDDISCAGVRWCVAVGQIDSTSVGGGDPVIGPDFADTWDGSSWKMTILPSPPGGADPELTSISCASGRRCVAVGSIKMNGVSVPYATEDNGGVWSDVSPTVMDTALLSSVSCVPRGACTAVGYGGSGPNRHPLVERWWGHHWTSERVQAPSDSIRRDGAQLVSVSCTAAPALRRAPLGLSGCAAVGDYGRQTREGLDVGWFVESFGPALRVRTGPQSP